ncbi:MAG: holo-ACP synthase [Clostridiaceae bacterium]|nr:holo-ACP synthase [Clostridiaceae bacterium]
MSVHCGVDIIEIDRVKKSVDELAGFKSRVFTEKEIAYCEGRNKAKYESYAARFAAKEAVLKALGTGLADGVEWKHIEISNDERGKPVVLLTCRALDIFREMNGKSIDISLSHCSAYAVAYAVIES